MADMQGAHVRLLIVSLGAGGTLFARRCSVKTLLVGVVCGEIMGLLPGGVLLTQGSTG